MSSKGLALDREQRRRLAVQRVEDGWLQKDVAAFLGVSQRAVGRWVAAFRAKGADGLKARPHPGREPFLTEEQQFEALAWLVQPATAFGFPTPLWTARRLAELIGRRFGVRFHPGYLREWLAKRGHSPQKPQRRAKERDQAGIDRWRAEDWPRLQKKRPPRAPTSS